MRGVNLLRPSRLLALTLVVVFALSAWLADHALRRVREVVEADVARAARQAAAEAGSAVRAEIAAIERDASAGRPHDGAEGWRVAMPLSGRISVQRARFPASRAERIVATASRDVTGSGLPVAVVAAIALDEPAVSESVAEALLSGRLPVNPDDLPRLAERLGAGQDPRVAPLLQRLRAVPPAPSIPRLPEFLRVARDGGLEGWSRDGSDVVHWRIASADATLARLGLDARATEADGVAVPDLPGLALAVTPDDAPLRRLARQGMAAALAFCGLAALGVAACLLLWREEEALRRERAFLATITHELRTPVTAVRLLGETLAEGRGDPREYGELIAEETGRLEALVEKSLLAARTEAELQFIPVNMLELLERAVRLAEPLARRKGKRVELSAERLPAATWDGEAVRQALSNLIDNALRHGGSHVVVTGSADVATARLEVRDDGPGIVRRERRRVFERFGRGTTAAGGTGLGLWLVEEVARAHGGRVELRTEEGAGCTFTLVLPLHAESRP